MKTFLFFIAAFAVSALQANAQNTSGPVMTFKEFTIDYGKIERGSNGTRKFEYTNTGNEPLIIKTAKGSCGCVQPTFRQEPIMPGETFTIDVRYDTNRPGPFTKTVTLTTNETPDTHTLTIKGEVMVPPSQEGVPAPTGDLKN